MKAVRRAVRRDRARRMTAWMEPLAEMVLTESLLPLPLPLVSEECEKSQRVFRWHRRWWRAAAAAAALARGALPSVPVLAAAWRRAASLASNKAR